jgi:hypothetical protein
MVLIVAQPEGAGTDLRFSGKAPFFSRSRFFR